MSDNPRGAPEGLIRKRPFPISPSRASDFKACAQLYKFRNVDRIPEPAEPSSATGNLVHSVLDRLLRLDPSHRTLDRALDLLHEAWREFQELAEWGTLRFEQDEEIEWLTKAETLIQHYFDLEDPTTVQAQELEWWVEYESERLTFRGIVDRVEEQPDGEWILSDYKTGASPSESASFGSFFGLRFYALVCWRAFGKIPKELRLVHLKRPEVIRLFPTQQMLEGLERQLEAIGSAIKRAHATGDWRARRRPLCNWCAYRGICPAWKVEEGASDAAEVILGA